MEEDGGVPNELSSEQIGTVEPTEPDDSLGRIKNKHKPLFKSLLDNQHELLNRDEDTSDKF